MTALRKLDLIDMTQKITPDSAASINTRFDGVETTEMLSRLFDAPPYDDLAIVSSFGTESAVLLHMVSQIDKSVPLIFVNTQKIFGETLA